MNTKQLWKVKTRVAGRLPQTSQSKTRLIVVADFAELQSVLVEDDVISAKFVRDVEVVEDEPTEDAPDDVRRKFGSPVEDEEASKT